MQAAIFLDVSRLLLRAGRLSPTGIDRVELAYARKLRELAPERLNYVAVHPAGRLGLLPAETTSHLIDRLAAIWSGENVQAAGPGRLVQAQLLAQLALLRPLDKQYIRERSGIYLNVSHQYLNKPKPIAAFKAHGGRVVCLVHDLIPIEWPEFVRPAAADRHRERMRTLAALADGVIFPSAATQRAAQPWLSQAARPPREAVIPLGVPANRSATRINGLGCVVADVQTPYFICLGTIEPRKNHLMLLHLWRRLAETGRNWPRLFIIGSRGWENENIIDMLERTPFPHGMVEEIVSPDDGAVHRLLAGARALLFPTIAEGYGLPVIEALSLGVPVLCSDLPILREVGGDVPEYLDAFDLPKWMEAVQDYILDGSPRRQAQLDRMQDWPAPTWEQHMGKALRLLHEIEAK